MHVKKNALTVSARLSIGFGAILMLFVVGAAISLWQLRAGNSLIAQIVDDGNVKLALAEDLSRQVSIGIDCIKTVMIVNDKNVDDELLKRGYEAKKAFLKDREMLREMTRSSSEAAALVDNVFETMDKRTAGDAEQFMAFALKGQRDEAAQWLVSRAAPSMQALQDTSMSCKLSRAIFD